MSMKKGRPSKEENGSLYSHPQETAGSDARLG